MKRMSIIFTGVAVLTSILFPLGAQAAKGFYVSGGMGLVFPSMSGDFMDEYSPGPGDVLELPDLGYGFTEKFAVGFFYGVAAGGLDDDFDEEAAWGQGYMGIKGRYSFDNQQQFVPYVELGIGSYLFMALGDDEDIEMETDTATTGFRIAVGGNYYMGNKGRFFLAPELSYHMVEYDCDAEIENDFDYEIEFDENASMFLILLKIGYHWKRD